MKTELSKNRSSFKLNGHDFLIRSRPEGIQKSIAKVEKEITVLEDKLQAKKDRLTELKALK